MSNENPQFAYPICSHGGVHEHQVFEAGMTMRQYYKAALANGYLASHGPDQAVNNSANFAAIVAEVADALLAEDAAHQAKGAK